VKEYNAENHAQNLPDAYKKTNDSNNYKILAIEQYAVNDFRKTLQQLEDCTDLDKATGKTLDYYGDTVGQPRGLATDEQYILMIKAKIMRNLSNGSYQSIVNSLCMTFNCKPSQVSIIEADEPCVVQTVALPLDIVETAGLTVSQTTEIIKKMLPVGIKLETSLLEGTFEFGENENETDENAGFAISEDNQTIGGYFGTMQSENIILPI